MTSERASEGGPLDDDNGSAAAAAAIAVNTSNEAVSCDKTPVRPQCITDSEFFFAAGQASKSQFSVVGRLIVRGSAIAIVLLRQE